MLRKRTNKSNVRIGIFSGKSTNYNLAILETLLRQPATAWQIASAIQKKINPSKGKDVIYYRTQKIYSVIQRKSGRLDDLHSKGYIKEEKGKWKLTRKGLIALNVEKPEFVKSAFQESKDTLDTMFKQYISAIPDGTLREPFGIQIDISKLKPYFETFDPMRLLKVFLEESEILLSQGIELDSISEKDLLDLVLVKSGKRISEDSNET